MTASRPTFRQIAPLDVDDAALGRVTDQLGVPTLKKPPAEKPSGGQGKPQDVPGEEPLPSPPARQDHRPSRAKTTPMATPGPVERFCFQLPGYLSDAMKLEAARQHTSLRHIVLRGLAAIGFEIAPEDLAPDARRVSAKPPKA